MSSWTGAVRWLGAALVCVAAGAAACSAQDASAFASGENRPGDGGGDNTPGLGGDATPPPGSAAASGVVIVHAASFPAFRLCFSNLPNLQPQPDSKVMPDANVVGVEVGSVVRIDPLDAPGDIFVIDEKLVQSAAGSSGRTCGELTCATGSTCLQKDRDYHLAGHVDAPLGKANVQVLAITGCGAKFDLDAVGAKSEDCPKTPRPWDLLTGNLDMRVITLAPQVRNQASIPAQVVHMSFLADNEVAAGNDLEVSFGKFSGGSLTSIAHDPTLYQPGTATELAVDTSSEAIYAQAGFRVAIVPKGGGAAKYSLDLSLADVQSLSSPRDVPGDYYRVASNYALLLLGDPRISPKVDGGAPDPNYDPRRGIHLLAVPVLDPAQLDAGSEGGTTGDQ
jgi:hypothetical protein